jgi:hypoxanthine phosphoribosyltransferase|tara:strand:- start:2330 stop:2890 length:561 start_codon:yes stop_codon:yes gene_type:complete
MNLLQWRKTLIKKKYYSWNDVEKMCHQITVQLYNSNWRPDLIVGITRGGNVPATMLSNMLDIPADAIKISFRDDNKVVQSSKGLAEEAFGLKEREMPTTARGKKILIVDDINDSGATFKALKEDWQKSCLPDDPWWEQVWGKSVRFCTLTENLSSEFDQVDYYSDSVNKADEDVWLVYPWENISEY